MPFLGIGIRFKLLLEHDVFPKTGIPLFAIMPYLIRSSTLT